MAKEPFGQQEMSAYSRSLDLQQKAFDELPEGTSSNYRGKTSYSPNPMVYMESGDGAYIRDVDGNEYIDMFCGVSAIITGHSPEGQVEAVKSQLERGSYFATTYEREYETAKLMNEIVPNADLTKFISTGTEANMSAIRLARAYTGKKKILKFEGMYHGHNDYLLTSVHPAVQDMGTRRDPYQIPSSPGIPQEATATVETLPFNDAELLAEKLKRSGDEIAALVTEATMSNSGLIYPNEGFLKEIRRLTHEHDVLWILDEVVTGFRMGLKGAQGYYNVEPDLAVFGKAMANGYPSAAVTGRKEYMEFLQPVPGKADFSGTFSGNPVSMAATHANLQLLRDIGEPGYEEFHKRGQQFVKGLREICDNSPHTVHIPDFAGFTTMYFTDQAADPAAWDDYRDIAPHYRPEQYREFAAAMIGEGVYMVPRPWARINLSHAHTDEDVKKALEAAKVAIESVST